MTLFQFILICTGFVFVLFSLDLFQRQKFNFLHFLVFFGGTSAIVIFSIRPDFLATFGSFFGVARGADIIVYMSIIFLVYVYFELLHKDTKQDMETSRLATAYALREYTLQRNNGTVEQPIGGTDTKDRFGFLIRAYNEDSMIGEVIDEIIGAGFSTIVVCNDGSSDRTETIIQQKIEQYPHIRLILLHHLINRGPGAANKTLFAFARTYSKELGIDRRTTYDADGQMDIADMTTFMQYAERSKYDVIIGSRFVDGASAKNIPLLRKIILLGSRVVTWIFNHVWLSDVSTGYRMYHHTALANIHITSDRFSYQNEIIGSIRKHHLRFVEIPVHIKYTEYSLSKGQSNMSAIKILKELIYKTLFFK